MTKESINHQKILYDTWLTSIFLLRLVNCIVVFNLIYFLFDAISMFSLSFFFFLHITNFIGLGVHALVSENHTDLTLFMLFLYVLQSFFLFFLVKLNAAWIFTLIPSWWMQAKNNSDKYRRMCFSCWSMTLLSPFLTVDWMHSLNYWDVKSLLGLGL